MKQVTLSVALVALAAAAGCEPVALPPGGGGTTFAASGNPAPAGSPGGGASRVERLGPTDASSFTADFALRIRALERAVEDRDARIDELAQAAEKLGHALATARNETAAVRKELLAELERVGNEHAKTRADLDAARKTLEALRAASPVPNLGRDVPKIEGRVLSVGRGEKGPLVLLDAGARRGVDPSFQFAIRRAGKTIATIALDRVDTEVSEGHVVFAREGDAVAEGDLATTRP